MLAAAQADPPALCGADSLHIVVLAARAPVLTQAFASQALECRDRQLCDGLSLLGELVLGLQAVEHPVKLLILLFKDQVSVSAAKSQMASNATVS